tara:strand:+ start:574 stop:1170 length:597 start_codon:yes stop_codon:yes gene_type:complete
MKNSTYLKNIYPFKKILQFFLLIFFSFLITSCGLYRPTDVKTNPINDAEKRKKNLEEGRGFRLSTAMGKKGGVFDFASSNPMWRASLNVLDFIPLVNADYGGGIIITDWFSENNSKDSMKITVMFLSNEIRADGLEIIIHEKKCLNETCTTSLLESDINNQIKLAILKKAAILKTADLKKAIKKDGQYPTKKNRENKN